jgi:CDP-diacylglycerol--glycerol-3-phosphate 3-phosphatidyltransferase
MEINVPNRITLVRLFVAFVLFIVLVAMTYRFLPRSSLWYCLAAALFILGAATDALDGYFARKWKQVTGFGRVADPFVDKILVCGAFTLMIPLELIPAWFVVIVIVRELGITALRGQLESAGKAFGAGRSGKLKMLSQSVLIPTLLVYAAFHKSLPEALWYVVAALVGLTLLLTILSGLIYLKRARLDFS